jgi:hypothetical protein
VRWLPVALALLALGGAIAGCATQTAPDDMLITRTGSIPGARLSLRLTDDGHASCNRGPLREVPSADLIQTRALTTALSGAGKRHERLAPQPDSILSYTIRLQSGTLRFSDNSRGQSTSMFKVAYLTRQIAKGVCHLTR